MRPILSALTGVGATLATFLIIGSVVILSGSVIAFALVAGVLTITSWVLID